jgi:hypothetical protein
MNPCGFDPGKRQNSVSPGDLIYQVLACGRVRGRFGRFLLTGSANLMVLPKVTESLAGRMETVTLGLQNTGIANRIFFCF